MKKTRNWSTAHQDYPPKISPKSKCLHTFYARTRALHFLFSMVEQKFAMPIHCYNIVHELTSIHLFAVPPSSLFQFRQQENLRNISAVPPTTNQQWPHKTNDWSKNLLFTNVQIVFVYVHEWMHIKYLHIIYSKCVRWEKERGGDLKWQWSKHDKNAGRTNKFSNDLSINLFVVELLLIRSVSLFFSHNQKSCK